MFMVNGITFEIGDIVERWDKIWKYWTTIQTQEDAEKTYALDTAFFRVVRGPEKHQVLYR